MKRLLSFLPIFFLLLMSCRIRSIEPEDYRPTIEGYLSPKEVREVANYKFSKAGVKLTPNITLNLRGVKIITDGYDPNLNVGYVYLINPLEDTKFTQEYQRPLSKSEMEILENLRKTEGYYILFINEGPREKVEGAIDEFIQLLYSKNVILKPKGAEKTLPETGQDGEGEDVSREETEDLEKSE